jgi:hypothetical protein
VASQLHPVDPGAGTGVPQPTEAGHALIIELPTTTSRSLQAYRLSDLGGGAS